MKLKAAEIEKRISRFHSKLARDQFHRYRSWEHCYRHFRRIGRIRTDADVDAAALQLGFYLASWGMYRGSSFLLWKDYTIHKSAVRLLREKEFRSLWDLDVANLGDSQ